MYSNCCGASEWMENSDICGDCKEHAVFTEEEEEEEFFSQRRVEWLKSYRNGCRECKCMTQSDCKNEK